MRIAFVTETYPPELNGVSGTVARAVSWLRARGHSVQLIRPRQPGESASDSEDEWRVGGAALPMYRDLRIGMPVLGGLKRRWRLRPPEIVHIATEGPLGWAARRAARALALPVSSDLRTNFDLYSAYYGFGAIAGVVSAYLRHFHNGTDLTFVPTRALAEQLRNRGFRQLAVVGRGVDTERFNPALRNHELRMRWGAARQDPVLIHVGRLAAEKNVELVMRAFAAVRQRCASAQLVIVGDGPLRGKLERKAGANVHFTGTRRDRDLAECYASGDIFLFPSTTETFGNVTLEALASGLVLVAYRSAAAAAHVRHGANGLLAAPGDELRFIELACRAAENAQGLMPMRILARRTALATSWDAVLSVFETALLSLRAAPVIATPAYAA